MLSHNSLRSAGANRRQALGFMLEGMAHAGKGRLKLYMGYAAGVGKTYRMLEEARELRQWFDDMDGFTTGRAQSL